MVDPPIDYLVDLVLFLSRSGGIPSYLLPVSYGYPPCKMIVWLRLYSDSSQRVLALCLNRYERLVTDRAITQTCKSMGGQCIDEMSGGTVASRSQPLEMLLLL